MTKACKVIHWFRQDLRLQDNPALTAATQHGQVFAIYILDDTNAGEYAMGGASRWWLHHSLQSLNSSLNGKLSLYRGDPLAILNALIARYHIQAVYWNRCYEPWRIQRDKKIKAQLQAKQIAVESHNSALLWQPWQVKKQDGTPYKVFTPFYHKGCLQAEPPRKPTPAPKQDCYQKDEQGSIGLAQLGLLPKHTWYKKLAPHWRIGEPHAHHRFQQFINHGLANYQQGRDFPAQPFVSRLSPYLHFGEISPHQLWYGLRSVGANDQIDHFCRELGWREFSYSQLYYNPQLPRQNLQTKFNHFPWVSNATALAAWQQGQTGIPLVDAGMRQLWQTGYMHNRVRMIVGSFLVKNLRLHWHYGEQWFWQTLVDADLANNSASWQWVAGCGADAAPYFRIFNPVTQGQRFDPEGVYIRQFVPEIADLPNQYLFSPWQAPAVVLQQANIRLGATYPEPLVDLKQSRMEALAAYQSLAHHPVQ